MPTFKASVIVSPAHRDVLLKLVRGQQLDPAELQEIDDIEKWLTSEDPPLYDELFHHATQEFVTDDVEIDSCPPVSRADGGTWVGAWLWVADADFLEDDEEEEADAATKALFEESMPKVLHPDDE